MSLLCLFSLRSLWFSSGLDKPVVVYSYFSFHLKNLYLFAYFEHVKKFIWSVSDLTSQERYPNDLYFTEE